MTLLLDVAVIGGGILIGRWISRAVRARRGKASPAVEPSPREEPARPPFEGLPCALGDVVVRSAERDEAWLAGALVFEEAAPVSVLFVAPEAGADRGVYVRHDAPRRAARGSRPSRGARSHWPPSLPTRSSTRASATSEPRRLPVRVRRLGTGAPEVGPEAVVADYTAAGGRRLVVGAGKEQTHAWGGECVAVSRVEVLPRRRRRQRLTCRGGPREARPWPWLPQPCPWPPLPGPWLPQP